MTSDKVAIHSWCHVACAALCLHVPGSLPLWQQCHIDPAFRAAAYQRALCLRGSYLKALLPGIMESSLWCALMQGIMIRWFCILFPTNGQRPFQTMVRGFSTVEGDPDFNFGCFRAYIHLVCSAFCKWIGLRRMPHFVFRSSCPEEGDPSGADHFQDSMDADLASCSASKRQRLVQSHFQWVQKSFIYLDVCIMRECLFSLHMVGERVQPLFKFCFSDNFGITALRKIEWLAMIVPQQPRVGEIGCFSLEVNNQAVSGRETRWPQLNEALPGDNYLVELFHHFFPWSTCADFIHWTCPMMGHCAWCLRSAFSLPLHLELTWCLPSWLSEAATSQSGFSVSADGGVITQALCLPISSSKRWFWLTSDPKWSPREPLSPCLIPDLCPNEVWGIRLAMCFIVLNYRSLTPGLAILVPPRASLWRPSSVIASKHSGNMVPYMALKWWHHMTRHMTHDAVVPDLPHCMPKDSCIFSVLQLRCWYFLCIAQDENIQRLFESYGASLHHISFLSDTSDDGSTALYKGSRALYTWNHCSLFTLISCMQMSCMTSHQRSLFILSECC